MPNSKSSIEVSCEGVLAIEAALAEHPFMGSDMGGVLNDVLIKLFLGKDGWRTSAVAHDVFEYFARTLRLAAPRSATSSHASFDDQQGKILCTWISEKPSLANLVLPVVRQLGPERVIVLGANDNMRRQIPEGATFLSRKDLPRARFFRWYSPYVRALPGWHSSLRSLLRQYEVPRRVLPRLHLQLLLACSGYAAYEQLLDQIQPAAVLTEYDRNSFTAPLVLAARARGIPTLTMVHGVINAACGFTPLLADRVLVWGRKGKQTLIDYGVEADRIDVVGYPVLDGTATKDAAAAREKIGIPDSKSVALLATNPIRPESRLRLAEVFCESLSGKAELAPVARLHPSEDVRFYDPVARRFPDVQFLPNDALSLEESLSAADVVVCHNTAYGFDALVRQTPVVILDVLDEPLLSAASLVTDAGCPVARDAASLAETVDRILTEEGFRASLMAPASEFVAEVYDAFGAEAARRTATRTLDAVSEKRTRV